MTTTVGHSHTNSSEQPLGQFALSAVLASVSQPITVAKVLIQIGYEPVSPVNSTSIFGNPVLLYPNVFKYAGFIRRRDGFWSLYRGLGARLFSGFIASAVSSHASTHLARKMNITNEEPPKDEEILESLKRVCRQSAHESLSRCMGTIASHPLQVVCVRMIAQLVGKEVEYSSMWRSIGEIYKQEGILGFFAGLVPRLVGEAVTIWTVNFMVHLVTKHLIPDDESTSTKGLRSYANVMCTMLVSHFTYPFTVVSTCMAVNNTRLAAGTPPHMPYYDNWRQCFSELSAQGEIKRGSGMFCRYYNGPVIMRHDGKPMPATAF